MLCDNSLLVCGAGVLRRAPVARVGGFDPQIQLMEDADFHFVFCANARIRFH